MTVSADFQSFLLNGASKPSGCLSALSVSMLLLIMSLDRLCRAVFCCVVLCSIGCVEVLAYRPLTAVALCRSMRGATHSSFFVEVSAHHRGCYIHTERAIPSHYQRYNLQVNM
jgi:hypothetical protein